MVYEYTTTVDFPLTQNKNGWYVTEEAVKKMVRYYNTHDGYKAPVVIEKSLNKTDIIKTIAPVVGTPVVGTVDSSKKLLIEYHDKTKYSVKIPVLLKTDFSPEKFYQAVDLCNVNVNPNNPDELISFRIESVVAIPKNKENKNEL